MKNRAKCKKCLSVIESYHSTDWVDCKCGEISVDGGEAMRCGSKNWSNFVRVDDEGNEIVPIIKSPEDLEDVKQLYNEKPTRKELVEMLDSMIQNVENLPDHAKLSGINHYDYCALIMLLAQIFKTPE